MSWIQTVLLQELEGKGCMVYRSGARQIALWKVNGAIFALNNRCPHEGYPLHEGTVNSKNCVLTCNWHNWKFDLSTGANVIGEDHVTSYKTRIDDGRVLIEIPEIPAEVRKENILSDIKQAFLNKQYGRIARELARLHFNALDL